MVCASVGAPSQAALSRGLMTVVWDVGAGTSVMEKSWVVRTLNYRCYGKVTALPFDWYRNDALRWPGRSSAGQVWCSKSRTDGERPTFGTNGTVTYETVMKPS